MLIYIVSLTLQSMVDITINNQCPNIELVSPVYFIRDAMCRIQFPQQVNAKSIVKANFVTDMNLDALGGALLYHLQRKEDASISTQLLIIWGCKSDWIYSNIQLYLHVYLIEHESTLVWNEDKLKRLYHVYNNQYDINIVEWWLNDNTRLNIERESLHEGFEMEMIISEGKGRRQSQKPLWIDSNM
jgi:hypothetical protein